jgi:hypothetical protein
MSKQVNSFVYLHRYSETMKKLNPAFCTLPLTQS